MNARSLIERFIPEALGPVLAEVEQDGYVLRIHKGASQGGLWPNDPLRVGTMSITSPEGVTVQAGYWMDWPEPHWKLSDKAYKQIPIEQRAQLEAKEQLKYGLAYTFDVHSRPTRNQMDLAAQSKFLRRNKRKRKGGI